MKTSLFLLAAFLFSGCSSKPDSYDMYGPDSYTVECINGEVWILSDKHGKANIGIECKEDK